MTTALSGLPELLQIGRENALLGNYQTALTYYDGVNAQVASYLVSLLRLSREAREGHTAASWLAFFSKKEKKKKRDVVRFERRCLWALESRRIVSGWL